MTLREGFAEEENLERKNLFAKQNFRDHFTLFLPFVCSWKKRKFRKKNKKIARKIMQTFREKMQKFHEKNGNCARKNENFAKNAEFLKQTQNSNIYWRKRIYLYDIMKIKYWVINADSSQVIYFL